MEEQSAPGDPRQSITDPSPLPLTTPGGLPTATPPPPVTGAGEPQGRQPQSDERLTEAPPRSNAVSAPPARTRSSTAYVGVGVGLVVLVLVLVFIIQNLNDASVHYLGLHFNLPVGLLILAGAVAGGVIVLLVSLARVTQLRVRARRSGHGHHDVR